MEKLKGLMMAAGFSVLTGILFYRSIFGIFITLPLAWYFYHQYIKSCVKKMEHKFQGQFKEALQHLLAALSIGYSIENAIRACYRDLLLVYQKDERICREFAFMVHQLKINCTAQQVFQDFDNRVVQEDLHNFVTVFLAANRSGGNLPAVMRKASSQICEKIETGNEIQSLIASKQMEFRVMSFVPFGILFYMQFGFGEVMGSLYGNPVGITVMSVCLLGYMGAYHLGRYIVEIEV